MTRPGDERGFTLVELLVTVALLSIVSLVILGFLDNTSSVTTRAIRHVEVENEARLALRTMTQEIRGAKPIATVYPSSTSCPGGSYPTGYARCLSFEVNRSVVAGEACPKRVVTYGLKADGILREDRTEFDATCAVVASRSYTGRHLIQKVDTGAGPMFSFFGASGGQLTATDAASLPTYADARAIRVSLVVEYQKRAPKLRLSSVLSLRNNR